MDAFGKEPVLYSKKVYLDRFPVFLNNCEITDYDSGNLHYHDFIEICYIAEGHGLHRIRDHVAPCSKGDIYIIDTGVAHCFFKAPGDSCRMWVKNLIFLPEFIYNASYDHHDIVDIYKKLAVSVLSCDADAIRTTLSSAQFTAIEQLYADIKYESDHRPNGAVAAVNAQVTLFLIKLMRYLEENVNEKISCTSPELSIVERAKKFIAQNYFCDRLTLEMVAENIYTGKSYLCRVFKNVTGVYFSDYLRSLRLQEACRLLVETDLSNERIMDVCGFHDVPHFYAAFKKHMGTTPKQYRICHRKSEGSRELS